MSSTTINHLPDECLEEIFKYLCGKDVMNASRVCSRWQSAVAGCSEKFWRRLCTEEYSNVYEESYRVSGLNWRELYTSLSLWENVADAEVSASIQPLGELTDDFHLLKDCVISVPIACTCDGPGQNYDTVIYYNVKTRLEINRIKYDVIFRNYLENDNIIVFEFDEGTDTKIRIITKVKQRKVTHHQIIMKYRPWLLIGNEIFYMIEKDEDEPFKFCRMRVIIDNENVRYETIELATCGWHDMLDVKYVGNKIYVFQKYEGNGYMSIAEVINNDLEKVCDVEELDHTAVDVLDILKQYGFTWSNRNIFNWMIYRFDEESRFSVEGKLMACPLTYGPHVMAATVQRGYARGNLYVYLNAYDASGKFILDRVVPSKYIDIDGALPEMLSRPQSRMDDVYLEQLEVVETTNGHMLLLLYCRRLVIIDLTHNVNLGGIEEIEVER